LINEFYMSVVHFLLNIRRPGFGTLQFYQIRGLYARCTTDQLECACATNSHGRLPYGTNSITYETVFISISISN
ncbi:hypothetical protein L9F63_008677, partial [Diploptera punctata]